MDQVGRYQIIEELGRGAHGIVYKAMDPAIRRTVAIKSIALGSAIAEEDRDRVREGILREARLAGTLSHPNIVTVYDVLDNGDSAYIFMEFVDGKSLEWAISSTRAQRPDGLSRAEFVALFRQVAEALDYAHRKGIIHRDVKPANILLTERNGANRTPGSSELLAKIADFGVAKFASPEVTQSLTGTPNYMSPEQVTGTPVTGASDQFSLAVIAYEVLTGRKAFLAESLEALLYKIKNEREELVDKANPELSQTVRKVMQCAMAKNPEQRFGSCSEFAGALEFALGDSPKWAPGDVENATQRTFKALVEYEAPPEPEEAAGAGKKKLALIAALCAAVVLAILLIVRMNSGPEVATQVLDTKSGTVSPPPLDLTASQSQAPPLKKKVTDQTDSAATMVEAPPPSAPAVKTVVSRAVKRSANTRRRKPLAIAAVAPKTATIATATSTAIAGEIQLLTDPPGATVVVDGAQSCSTPCSIALGGGRHTLVASADGFALSRRIFRMPGTPSLLIPMIRSVGVMVVASQPPGATVQVDGRAVGTTPVTLRLAAGAHRVSVWDGARWHDQNVELQGDEVQTRTFVF